MNVLIFLLLLFVATAYYPLAVWQYVALAAFGALIFVVVIFSTAAVVAAKLPKSRSRRA